MHHETEIDFQSIRAVVFDVDGTLYNQRKLRFIILRELLYYYSIRPHRLFELKIIRDFRLQREKNHFREVGDLDLEQYKWGAEASNVSVARVKSVINRWIYEKPLRHLEDCIYEDVRLFFSALADHGIPRIIFSDYPAKDKLLYMGLEAEGVICATDPDINRLKPNPRGLQAIMERWRLKPEELLFIGDRDDRDGECARQAGVPYLLKTDKDVKWTHTFSAYRSLVNQLEVSSGSVGATSL